MSDYFGTTGSSPRRTPRWCRGCRSITTWVCILGICDRFWRACTRAHQPDGVPAAAGPMDADAGRQHSRHFRQRRTSRSNWRRARHRTRTWPGSISADVLRILSGSERVHAATVQRFTDRFARFNFHDRCCVRRTGWPRRRCTSRPASRSNHRKIVHFDSEKLTAGSAKRCESDGGTPLVSYGVPRSPMVRIVDPETRTECPAGTDR